MLSVILLIFTPQLLAEVCQKAVIEILVSPLVDEDALRIMDLSWDVGPRWRPEDWVALYNQPPYQLLQPVFRSEAKNAIGIVGTGIQEGRILMKPNFQKVCLGWWAAYWHRNEPYPVAVSCLSTNPRWMEELKTLISSLKLSNAFIPGTHDSAAYLLAYKPHSEHMFYKYVYNQDEGVLEQLIHGARYLDLRIGLSDGHFWLYHGIAQLYLLQQILGDIKTFVENTNEIVILDFHEFRNGFNDRRVHHKLVSFLQDTLGEHIATPYFGWSATLGDIWRSGKRVIAAYNDVSVVRERPNEIWRPVRQLWGNKKKIEDLYSYFRDIYTRRLNNHGEFWSGMAELTPSFSDIIYDTMGGLRKMAYEVNWQVTRWFRSSWGAAVNGVAVDFIRSTGIVENAIRWNRRKANGSICD